MSQPPQLSVSLPVSIQLPSQQISPIDAQSERQTSHDASEGSTQLLRQHCSDGAQAVPHVPQFARSLLRSRHEPEHSARPASQESWQVLDEQTWPVGQRFPQAPQWARSFERSLQESSQSVNPASQDSSHLAMLHTSPGSHPKLQPPQ